MCVLYYAWCNVLKIWGKKNSNVCNVRSSKVETPPSLIILFRPWDSTWEQFSLYNVKQIRFKKVEEFRGIIRENDDLGTTFWRIDLSGLFTNYICCAINDLLLSGHHINMMMTDWEVSEEWVSERVGERETAGSKDNDRWWSFAEEQSGAD